MARTGLKLILAAVLLTLAAAPASAEDGREGDASGAGQGIGASGWEFQATLYLWATALNGSVGIRNLPTTKVDASFADILEDLNGAAMAAILARNGDWMILADLVYADLSDSATLSVANSPRLKFEQSLLIASAVAGYRLPINNPDLNLSVTAGLRYQRLEATTSLTSGAFPVSVQSHTTKQWLDPIFGLALQYDINDRWFLNGLADIGGFGVGSQLTAQGFLAAGYRWNDRVSTAVGYRALYTDYQSGSGASRFDYEATMHGPFMSLGVRF
ncbi:hypothetical protein LC092_16555 [Stappia stellulata]|uniref:hypothetical protein n=1 Tax=Stappia stellulata TaxID=71235 RepID=UPI001CD797AF|nr:hypothetical protein [Stappia stellulata]MCA1244060.1 hypothetical protein [Stappia stellulata]